MESGKGSEEITQVLLHARRRRGFVVKLDCLTLVVTDRLQFSSWRLATFCFLALFGFAARLSRATGKTNIRMVVNAGKGLTENVWEVSCFWQGQLFGCGCGGIASVREYYGASWAYN